MLRVDTRTQLVSMDFTRIHSVDPVGFLFIISFQFFYAISVSVSASQIFFLTFSLKFTLQSLLKVLSVIFFFIWVDQSKWVVMSLCYLLISVSCYCRTFDSKRLRQYAIEKVEEARSKPVTAESFFLVPHIPGAWGKNNPLNKTAITLKVGGMDKEPSGIRRDERCMGKFMRKARADVLVDPNLTEFQELVPCGSVLLDFLCLDSERPDSWDFPCQKDLDIWKDRRGVSKQWKDEVEVWEFVIGVDSEDNLAEFRSWVEGNITADIRAMPTSVLSLDIEEIKVTMYDLLRMSSSIYRDTVIDLHEDLLEVPDQETMLQHIKNKWENIPAKIMFGNGITWCAMISFDIRTTKTGYSFNCQGIPSGVIDLLQDLPVVTGVGIRDDVQIIEKIFTIIAYGASDEKNVRMVGFVDIANLAVLAGWRLEARDMTALSLITIGGTLNKICSRADGCWGIRYQEIPESLQIYAIADVKFGFLAYNILISLLMRQLFPDPDICCRMGKCTQIAWVGWCFRWIRDSLEGTAVFYEDIKVAATRRDLISSIRYRRANGDLSNFSPARIRLIADFVEWPTLTQGGPRFLQPVRLMYLTHYQVLKESIGIPGVAKHFPDTIKNEDRLYASYGHTDIRELDVSIPVPLVPDSPVEFWLTLVSHPHLSKQLFKPSVSDLSIRNIHIAAEDSDRDTREALLEWFRLDISRLREYFEACEMDWLMSRSYRGRYEELRLMFLYLVNRDPVGNPSCERSIQVELEEAKYKQNAYLQALQVEVEKQKAVCLALAEADSGYVATNRVSWKELPRPDWKVIYKKHVLLEGVDGPQRPRSRSRGRHFKPFEQRSYRAPVFKRRRVRSPTVHRGVPMAQRVSAVGYDDEEILVDRVQHLRDPEESTSGGRVSKSKKGKKGRSKSRSVAKLATQDEVEEAVREDPFDCFPPERSLDDVLADLLNS